MSGGFERVPPQNVEAEQSVLGAMLIEREALAQALEMLHPEDFYREAHRAIFAAMSGLFERGEAVDLITLSEALRSAGELDRVGGMAHLTDLAQAVPTAANVAHYARIVADKAVLRGLITASTELAGRAYEEAEEPEVLLDEAESRIFSLASRRHQQVYIPLRDILSKTFDRIEAIYNSPGGVTGVPSGFRDLDRLTAGLQPSDLIILAARPSMGKTMLCLNLARNASLDHGVTVALFSLEMSREQLAMRLLSTEAQINAQMLRTGRVTDAEWQRLSRALGRLAEARIFIDDTPALSALDVRARARRIQAEYGLGLIIIDYLQLMQIRGRVESRQQEISSISRSLKALARELKVPVLALSQLSRAVESRQDRRPQLSDLRESGAIEQDADLVSFIYRDEYYNPESDQKNIAEVIVAKQRNGPTGTVKLQFWRDYGQFRDLDEHHAT